MKVISFLSKMKKTHVVLLYSMLAMYGPNTVLWSQNFGSETVSFLQHTVWPILSTLICVYVFVNPPINVSKDFPEASKTAAKNFEIAQRVVYGACSGLCLRDLIYSIRHWQAYKAFRQFCYRIRDCHGSLQINTETELNWLRFISQNDKNLIQKIEINSNLEKIPNYCFLGLKNLIQVKGEGIEKIGFLAFCEKVRLQNVDMPNVLEIDSRAFHAISLPFVFFPKMKNVDMYTFFGGNVKNIIISGCESIGLSDDCTQGQLKNVYMPNVQCLYKEAFHRCLNLTNLSLPDTLTVIGSKVFTSGNRFNCRLIQLPVLSSCEISPYAFNANHNHQFRVKVNVENDKKTLFDFLQNLTKHTGSTAPSRYVGLPDLQECNKFLELCTFPINSLFNGKITVKNMTSQNLNGQGLKEKFAPLFLSDQEINRLPDDQNNTYKQAIGTCIDTFFDPSNYPDDFSQLSVSKQKEWFLSKVKALMDSDPDLYNFLDPEQIDAWESENFALLDTDPNAFFLNRKIAVFLSLLNGFSHLPFLSPLFWAYFCQNPDVNFIATVIRHLPLMGGGTSFIKSDNVDDFVSFTTQKGNTSKIMHVGQYQYPDAFHDDGQMHQNTLTEMEAACLRGSGKIFEHLKLSGTSFDLSHILALSVLSENADFLANHVEIAISFNEDLRQKTQAYLLAAFTAFVTGQENVLNHLLEQCNIKDLYSVIQNYCLRIHTVTFQEYQHLVDQNHPLLPSVQVVSVCDVSEAQQLLDQENFSAKLKMSYAVFNELINRSSKNKIRKLKKKIDTITDVPGEEAFKRVAHYCPDANMLMFY